jgi:hypothetical protein
MNLTVITHTNPDWNRDISKCIQSVKDALPAGCKHEIIELKEPEKLAYARYDAIKLNDIVVFVDDDDYIPKDSLHYVLEAMRKYQPGVVYTYETKVYKDGRQELGEKKVKYDQFPLNPQIVHHMTAFNTKCITSRCIDLANSSGIRGTIEWLMRTDAAYNNGALCVPINGYYWVQHDKQHHRRQDVHKIFIDSNRDITKEMKKWYELSTYRGAVPMLSDADLKSF